MVWFTVYARSEFAETVEDKIRLRRALSNLWVSESKLLNSGTRPTCMAPTSSISPDSLQRFRSMAPRRSMSRGISPPGERKDKSTNKMLPSSDRTLPINRPASDAAAGKEALRADSVGTVCKSLRADDDAVTGSTGWILGGGSIPRSLEGWIRVLASQRCPEKEKLVPMRNSGFGWGGMGWGHN